jgi:hypothetical protein
MKTTKFEAGNVYEMRFVTDSNLRTEFICTKRTEKTVTFETFRSAKEKITRKVKTYEGVEYVLDGNYSMAPCIKADRIIY